MIGSYYLIGMIFAGMSLATSWMFISTKYHYLIKVLGISLIVVGTIFCWSMAYSLIGYPILGYPDDGSVILAFHPNQKAETIELWILGKQGIAKGYSFPYDEKLLKKLHEAKKRAEQENALMKFHRNGKGEGGEDGGGKKGGNGGKEKRKGHDGTEFKDDIGPGFDILIEPALPSKEGVK
jgi:hypothetical protein